MNITYLNASVVVLAFDHNPTLLHPYFLKNENIINENEELAEPPVCTPAFSIVKMQSGIVFMVEMNKFQVIDNNPPPALEASLTPEYAKRYIEKLPHVEYKAVGINFSCLLEIDQPEKKIKSQYLKHGPWNNDRMNPKAMGLRLVYNVYEAELRFSINSGTVGEKRGILIDANYHTRASEPHDLNQIIRIISLYPNRCGHFQESLYRILDKDNLS
ncbi:MAG TPA: hypothetical protein PK878_14140 [bacterium]|nr:hypothetical protein [bacterium]HOL93006.1 hypothetical protein [bacterium]HPO99257.1 hypothetical protein [bacterium]HXK93099.1 hypothetical protein [bacterium]